MDNEIYKNTINLTVKISVILAIFFAILGSVRAFANDKYIIHYENDNELPRFKQFYISGFGSIVTFSTIFHKNSNYLKYKNGCGALPLYDSSGNQIQDSLGKNIYALCDVIYEYDHTGVAIDSDHRSDKMHLNIEGSGMWGFAVGMNTYSAFRTEIAYNSLFKNMKNTENIKGKGVAISKLDKNDYHIDFKSRSIFINAYFDVLSYRQISPAFVPYIMVGGGVSDNRVSVEYQASPTTLINIPSMKNFKLAFNGGVGFSSSVTNYIVFDMSVRYYNFGKMNTENFYIQNNVKNEFQGLTGKVGESYQIMMGLRFQI